MKNAKQKTEDFPRSPYLDGRREWSEQIGSRLKYVGFLQVVTLASVIVAGVAVAGANKAASVNRFIPYVVERDPQGAVTAVGRATEASKPDENSVRAKIGNWVTATRSVYFDASAQQKMVEEAYGAMTNDAPARAFVNEYMASHDPFKRAASEGVTVNLQTVLHLGNGDSWRVEWVETVRNREGATVSTTPMQAVITTQIIPPADEATILANPLGIYVKDVSWSQRL